MSDLVKRLRDQQTKWMTPLLGNAADRIEALEAKMAKAREEGRKAGLEEAAKECDRIADESFFEEQRQIAKSCAANIRLRAKTFAKGEE